MTPVILIPARMQATRLPGKPLADINGEPMIVHVWKRAAESGIGKVFVACDDEAIAIAVREAGGNAVMTGQHHASGSDRIYEALQIIDPEKKYDVVINVQGDVPTIEPRSIRAVLAPLQIPEFDIATLVCEIKREEEKTDPAVVKPVLSFLTASWVREGVLHDGPAGESERSSDGGSVPPNMARALYFTRATAPTGDGPLYHHIGIYAYRRKALETFVSLPPSALELREKLEQLRALEAGMKIGAVVVDTVPLGVDTPEHLERAREILSV